MESLEDERREAWELVKVDVELGQRLMEAGRLNAFASCCYRIAQHAQNAAYTVLDIADMT